MTLVDGILKEFKEIVSCFVCESNADFFTETGCWRQGIHRLLADVDVIIDHVRRMLRLRTDFDCHAVLHDEAEQTTLSRKKEIKGKL